MDISAASNASRPVQPSIERQIVPTSAQQQASRPETAEAVKATDRTEKVRDRRETKEPGELTDEEQRAVRELKARDREVRAHEQAHKNVGGPYAGAISYDLQQGPDGVNYAIGGSVPIDTSEAGSPEETVNKMQVVIRAALAPAEPSAADRAIAAAAKAKLAQAQADLTAERAAERRGEGGTSSEGLSAYNADAAENEPTISLSI